jgi:sterol-4alpha-carboxylate 3-dehydrogenase (decarboxylating)
LNWCDNEHTGQKLKMPGQESYLVIGGSGFLGRAIVEALVRRGEKKVAALDIVQRHFGDKVTKFYPGDITKEEEVRDVIRKCKATCVIHTASPVHNLSADIYWKVNVTGTQSIISACLALDVKKLVYTSSAGVVYNGNDLIDVDERLSPPTGYLDAYNETKAKAEELVIEANGKDGLKTVALRPAGIFGPGDRQFMPQLMNVVKNRQTGIQIGKNNNLFDVTYIDNVVHAHLLAADKLDDPPLSEDDILAEPLPDIWLSTGGEGWKVPTSEARPLGYVDKVTPELETIRKAYDEGPELRPVTRTKFDALNPNALALESTTPLQVAGQVFFITNGEPLYFWDFMRAVWKEAGHVQGGLNGSGVSVVLSHSVGIFLGGLAEWWSWLVGKEPGFTKYRVRYACTNRWYNIEKARRVLGYEPVVGVEEGIRRMAEWWKAEQAKNTDTTTPTTKSQAKTKTKA